jgi:hypothetical protein
MGNEDYLRNAIAMLAQLYEDIWARAGGGRSRPTIAELASEGASEVVAQPCATSPTGPSASALIPRRRPRAS